MIGVSAPLTVQGFPIVEMKSPYWYWIAKLVMECKKTGSKKR